MTSDTDVWYNTPYLKQPTKVGKFMSDKDASIFGSTPAPETTGQVASNQQEEKVAEASSQTNDPYADLLQTITTEDGRPKYANVSDAISSIPHAQKHIRTLEQELADMRAQMEKIAKEKEELITGSRLETQQQVQDAPTLREDQVAELVNKTLSQREQQMVQQKNVGTVVSTLTDKFGSSEAADKAYRAKAAEMGINLDMMNSLAMHSPQAVLAYFGTTGASAPRKTEGTLNTGAMPQVDPAKGKNPLLSGSMKDMEAEIARISKLLG